MQNHTKIVSCDCKHPHQDAQYGAGKRSANLTAKSKPPQAGVYRCTVCAKTH